MTTSKMYHQKEPKAGPKVQQATTCCYCLCLLWFAPDFWKL